MFFSTGREAWGRANDATTALAALLLIPPVVQVRGIVGPGAPALLGVATMVAVAGLLTVAVTSAMTALGRLAWDRSARIGGMGFAGFVAWLVVVGAVSLVHGGLPAALVWLGFGVVAAIAVTAAMAFAASRRGDLVEGGHPHASLWVVAGIAYVGAVVWIVLLGVELA